MRELDWIIHSSSDASLFKSGVENGKFLETTKESPIRDKQNIFEYMTGQTLWEKKFGY